MRRIVHHKLGEPARVLRIEDGPSTSLGPDQVGVRLSYAPIHPGDLLGIMGSPAFGTPRTIASDGRVPGFEGAGVVSEDNRHSYEQEKADALQRLADMVGSILH